MNSYEKYFREFGKEETNCAVCLSNSTHAFFIEGATLARNKTVADFLTNHHLN